MDINPGDGKMSIYKKPDPEHRFQQGRSPPTPPPPPPSPLPCFYLVSDVPPPAGPLFLSALSSFSPENWTSENSLALDSRTPAKRSLIKKGDFFGCSLVMYVIQHWSIWRPQIPLVSDDAGMESRTVTTLALTARRSNHSARFHRQKKNFFHSHNFWNTEFFDTSNKRKATRSIFKLH